MFNLATGNCCTQYVHLFRVNDAFLEIHPRSTSLCVLLNRCESVLCLQTRAYSASLRSSCIASVIQHLSRVASRERAWGDSCHGGLRGSDRVISAINMFVSAMIVVGLPLLGIFHIEDASPRDKSRENLWVIAIVLLMIDVDHVSSSWLGVPDKSADNRFIVPVYCASVMWSSGAFALRSINGTRRNGWIKMLLDGDIWQMVSPSLIYFFNSFSELNLSDARRKKYFLFLCDFKT